MIDSLKSFISCPWHLNRQWAILFLLLLTEDLAAEMVQSEVRLQPGREGTVWVGQELELNLELWTSGVSFRGQQFSLPQISGAYLLQADSSTIKLNENRDGQDWQGLRYSLLLYPQRAGRIEVPSFVVNFSASDSFVGDFEPFSFSSAPLVVEVTSPPGMDPGSLLVTTSDFSLESSWEPALSGQEPLQLKTGDALHLRIKRRAADVPAMVFAPLPEFTIDGLRAYPKAPAVNDRVNRGELEGMRTDSLTFICEQVGTYRVPDMRFQWWNPVQQRLNEEVVPGIEFVVVPNPAYGDSQPITSEEVQRAVPIRKMIISFALLTLLFFVARWFTPRFKSWLQKNRAERESGEDWAFRQLLQACNSGDAVKAYQASCLWLSRLPSRSALSTLHQLAQQSGNRELEAESERLQNAVASGSGSGWQGRRLGELLGKIRVEINQTSEVRNKLPPLNPVSG
jgi:hypothetical protein